MYFIKNAPMVIIPPTIVPTGKNLPCGIIYKISNSIPTESAAKGYRHEEIIANTAVYCHGNKKGERIAVIKNTMYIMASYDVSQSRL